MASLNPDLVVRFPTLSASDVTEIVETELTDAQINAFLNMAYFRTRPLAGGLGDCGGQDAEEQIIILLAAHFVKVYQGDPYDEWVGVEWRVRYRGSRDGHGLNATIYGQNAIAMDCSGILASSGLKRASIHTVDIDRTES